MALKNNIEREMTNKLFKMMSLETMDKHYSFYNNLNTIPEVKELNNRF